MAAAPGRPAASGLAGLGGVPAAGMKDARLRCGGRVSGASAVRPARPRGVVFSSTPLPPRVRVSGPGIRLGEMRAGSWLPSAARWLLLDCCLVLAAERAACGGPVGRGPRQTVCSRGRPGPGWPAHKPACVRPVGCRLRLCGLSLPPGPVFGAVCGGEGLGSRRISG